MTWKILLSGDSEKFLKNNRIPIGDIFQLIKIAIVKLGGGSVNIDIKKLTGGWSGFYRIRKGKLRVILEFNFDDRKALIEVIDWRGSIYK